MPVELLEENRKLRLVHPKGASAEVLLYGATVISWKAPSKNSSEPKERLFLSSKAFLDGSKPVRGGIPIVFPCFGPPTLEEHKQLGLGQHGYARSNYWTYGNNGKPRMDNDAGVVVELNMTPPDGSAKLEYVITLTAHQLSTDLHVTNTSSSPFKYQALLHTYIRAPALSLHVSGLQSLSYLDKTSPGPIPEIKLDSRANVDVTQFTDSVYEGAAREPVDPTESVDKRSRGKKGRYVVTWPGEGMEIKTVGFEDVVVWNPGRDKAKEIADMEEGGWERYVCVEPGNVAGFKELNPGETFIGGQTLTPIVSEGGSQL